MENVAEWYVVANALQNSATGAPAMTPAVSAPNVADLRRFIADPVSHDTVNDPQYQA